MPKITRMTPAIVIATPIMATLVIRSFKKIIDIGNAKSGDREPMTEVTAAPKNFIVVT